MEVEWNKTLSPGVRPFSSISIRNYRLFFFGQLISISGTWMQTVAHTPAPRLVGPTIGARFGPIFLVGPFGGVIADRFDKRRVLFITQALSAALALTYGLVVELGTMQMWIVYLLAAALGGVGVFDNPARQAFIPQLVPARQLRNAVTLNSVTANVARVIGAAFAGGIAAGLGLARCFELNAVSFLAVLLIALVFVGYGSITFNSLAKTAMQLAAAPEMRGHVMALWAVAWQGSTPIGLCHCRLDGRAIRCPMGAARRRHPDHPDRVRSPAGIARERCDTERGKPPSRSRRFRPT